MRIPTLRTPINRRIHHCLAILFLVQMAILINIVRTCACVLVVCLCIYVPMSMSVCLCVFNDYINRVDPTW